jgi:hypothetical protein
MVKEVFSSLGDWEAKTERQEGVGVPLSPSRAHSQ